MTHLTREELDRAPWFTPRNYPFTSRFMDVDGHRLHYLDEGQGQAIVFVHGTPS